MRNKKILYGVGIGLLGARVYPTIRKNMKPIARKVLKNVIIIGKNTKAFINEVLEETENEDKPCQFEVNKDTQYELKLLNEEQKHAFNKITELKRQLKNISEKVDNL
ncbi:hypothetical protein [Clostridium thailandense]|uniref:hypothetical protein n=1 Tax=Clostridium thailandense TaxID=2794346 RepID=UPI003989E084